MVIRVLRKFSVVLSKHQKLRIIELAILMLIGGILETCSVSLVVPFVNCMMYPEEIMDNKYVKLVCQMLNIQSSRDFLMMAAFALAMLYILKNVFLLFQCNIQYRFVYGNMFIMQKRLLDNLLHRPYEFFLDINSGEFIRLINGDTASAFQLLITLLGLFTELMVASMLVITIFIITPYVTLTISVVLIIVVFLLNILVEPQTRKAGVQNQKASAEMNKWLLQSIQGIKEIKVMSRENFFQMNFDRHGKIYVDTKRRGQVLSLIPRFFIEAISMSTMFIVVAVLIYKGASMEGIVPMLSAVAMAALRLLPSVNRISASLAGIAYAESMLDKLINNLQELSEAEMISGGMALEYNKKENDCQISTLKKDIVFNKITYSYPLAEENVLENSSLQIKAGESVGIVGVSGAGKTTAIDLILGLLRPQEGSILVDNMSVFDDIDGWHSQIGYIPQTIFLLDGNIKENILFGDEVFDEEKLWSVLREASLDGYVETLPKGIDTQIGERGMKISGGQRQRIGIARALYRDPSILIFDEATSALDNATEAAIMESIHGLHGKKTMIIIAHRLSTIEVCDRIFRIEGGKAILEKDN